MEAERREVTFPKFHGRCMVEMTVAQDTGSPWGRDCLWALVCTAPSTTGPLFAMLFLICSCYRNNNDDDNRTEVLWEIK